MDEHAHAGKVMLPIHVGPGASPSVRAIVEPGTDVDALLSELETEIKQVFLRRFGDLHAWSGESCGLLGEIVRLDFAPQVIKTREEDEAQWRRWFERDPAEEEANRLAWETQLSEWEQDRRDGWYRVADWKRAYIVKATSALDAYKKAEDNLANPSTAEVSWIGEELPELIEAG